MPVEFRALGTIDLRTADGRSAVTVLQQPKRLALLAYLAHARPRGFRRRDELLALLWPESDDQHARAALRKTVHAIRAALGAEVLVGRGDEELALDFELFHSDVDEFDAAIAEKRFRDASRLYRGELLPAFYATTSATFERWLDSERERLQECAARAASSVAKHESDLGNRPEAVTWARRALECSPQDETLVRQLLYALDAAGDRTGALDVYQEFRARLAREYDVDPAPETEALVAAIRARDDSHLTYVAPPVEPEVISLAVAPQVAAAAKPAPAAARRWSIPVAAALCLAGAAAWVEWNRPPSLIADRLVVAPFQVFDTSLTRWAAGVQVFVSRDLDQTGGLRVVPARVADLAADQKDARTESAAADLARVTGAGLVLSGSLLGQGSDSVRIDAVLTDARSGRNLGDYAIAGSRDRIDRILDSLVIGIVQSLESAGRGIPMRESRLSARSMPALKAFLDGELAMRRGAWDTAQIAFRRATALDTTLSLAWLRLGMTTIYLEMEGGDGPGWAEIRRAGRSGEGLSRHDSILVAVASGMGNVVAERMPHDLWRPEAARVLALALQMTRDYPDDPEAWFALGEVRGGMLALLPAVTWPQAADAMIHAADLDSTFVPAYPEALRYAFDDGDTITGVRVARRYLTLPLPPATRALPLLIVRMFDPRVTRDRREALLDSLPPDALYGAWSRLWLLPDGDERVVEIARAAHRRAPDPRYWFTADAVTRRSLAAVLAYRGHVREALALAGTENATWCPWLLPDLALAGAAPAALADSAIHDWIRRGWISGNGALYSFWWLAFEGDTVALDTLMHAGPGPPNSLAGALALARGDTAGAIQLLETFHAPIAADQFTFVELARLLKATGHPADALTVLQRHTTNNWPTISRVLWRLERAGLEDQLGHFDAARADYGFVVDVWRHADPELSGYVREATEALQRLSSR